MSEISKIKVDNIDYDIKSLPRIKELNYSATGINLVDNTVFRFTIDGLNSLLITLPSTINELFQCEIVFKSGTKPTSLTYNEDIKWSGDDIKNSFFVPLANKTYNIMFWYDGFNMNAVARGV